MLQHLYLVGTKTHRLFGYVNVASAELEIAYLCNRFEQSCSTSRETETSLTSMVARCIEVSLAGCCRPTAGCIRLQHLKDQVARFYRFRGLGIYSLPDWLLTLGVCVPK